jgi:hypothetical protein
MKDFLDYSVIFNILIKYQYIKCDLRFIQICFSKSIEKCPGH